MFESFKIITILVLLFSPNTINGQEQKVERQLIHSVDSVANLPISSMKEEYYNDMLEIAQEKEFRHLEANIYNALGSHEVNFGDIEEARIFGQKGFDLSSELADTLIMVKSLVHLGKVNRYNPKTKTNYLYYKQAYELAHASTNREAQTYSQYFYGLALCDGKKYAEGVPLIAAAKETYAIEGKHQLLAQASHNLACANFFRGSYKESLKESERNLIAAKLNEDSVNMAFSYDLIGGNLRKLGQVDEGIAYLDTAINLASTIKHRYLVSQLLKEKADLYEELGMTELALEINKEYFKAKETLLAETNKKSEAELTEVFTRTNQKNKEELVDSQKKLMELAAQRKRYLLAIVGLIISMLLGWALFFKVRNDLSRKKRLVSLEEELLKSQLEKQKIEAKFLEDRLLQKNVDLTNMALDIARKNEFSNQLLEKLSSLDKVDNQAVKPALRKVLTFATNHLQINEDLALLQENVESINQEFYQNMEHEFGSLTPNEKYLAGLIRLKLSNKDIAAIRNISVSSAKTSRYRLRKRLGITPEVNLVEFLQKI